MSPLEQLRAAQHNDDETIARRLAQQALDFGDWDGGAA